MPFAKILKYLACGGALLAGIFCVYAAFHFHRYSLLAWAVTAVWGGITGFIYGTSGEPTGSLDPQVGGKFLGLPDWLVYVDGGLVVVSLILSFLF